ncbi:MAG: DUF4194 domain-containing protein [Bacteroidota bacterium]|nr:DUF4194 domain-containing protein [Bacteroidota bacterium]MDP3145601.1 DUF4194 domain-containing protein [Bacteroidota bacterium]
MEEYLERHSLPIIYLFKGVLYNTNEAVWKSLIQYQNDIKNYFSVVGIDLIINQSEGFAFLKQREIVEETTFHFPKLIEKRQLSYPVSLLCILLRKKLLDFDNTGEESRLILSKEQIVELILSFLPDNTSNEKKVIDKIDVHIKRLIELGFLRELKNEQERYEVSRILIAYLPVEELQNVLDKLKDYHASWLDQKQNKEKDEFEF